MPRRGSLLRTVFLVVRGGRNPYEAIGSLQESATSRKAGGLESGMARSHMDLRALVARQGEDIRLARWFLSLRPDPRGEGTASMAQWKAAGCGLIYGQRRIHR